MDEQAVAARDGGAGTLVRSRTGVLLLIACASIAGHAIGWSYVGSDVGDWLLPWYEHIVENGRVAAFAAPFSNYTPVYLYLMSLATLLDGLLPAISLIKLVAVLGTAALAGAVYHLLAALEVPRSGEKALCIFLLPSALLNAPVLAQCDAMWSAACVMAVAEAIRRRPAAVLFWCGVALSLKLQAAFLAPFVFAWLLSRKVPIALWAIPPAVYAAAMIPAWLAGWPASDLATIYVRQAHYPHMVGNASNPWVFATLLPDHLIAYSKLGFVAAMAAVIAYIRTFSRRDLQRHDLLLAALLSSMLLPFFLPKMHERYFFLADILAIACFWSAPAARTALIALAVQLGSILALLGYFLDNLLFPMFGSVMTLFALAAVGRDLAGVGSASNDPLAPQPLPDPFRADGLRASPN